MNLQFHKNPKLPMIFQNEVSECGHACVTMISNFLGHRLDLPTLRKISKPSNRGVTLADLKALFCELGCSTRALRVPLEELKQVKTPAILHWNMNHFVVLKKVGRQSLTIHDPASGVQHCSLQEASNIFTGIVLEVEKTEDFSSIQGKRSISLLDLAKHASGLKKTIIFLLTLSCVIEIFSLFSPLFIQYVTDQVLGANNLSNLYPMALAFACIVGLQSFAEYMRGNMIIYVTKHLTEQFSSNIVRHILKLPLDFFERRHKGDLQSKFQSVDHIQKKISADFVNTVLDGLMIVMNLLVMLAYSILLSCIVLTGLFIFLLIRYASYQALKQETESWLNRQAKASSLFLEMLHGIVPIKSFLKEDTRFNTWRNAYIQSLNADITISKMNQIYSSINQLFFQFEHIIVITIAASLVLSGRFSSGMLIAFLSYRLLLVNKALSFIQSIFDYKLISVELNRLSDILLQAPETLSRGKGLTKPFVGALSLQNITFRYNQNERDILQNISLSIAPGEKVALVGPSGCGKSTLLKIMMGLITPDQGAVIIDGIPIGEFGLKNFRELSAQVMQDDCLLSGSILDNITFFAETQDLERVYQVAEIAYIHEMILSLPMGYETLIGDMGSTLSGGQKQRILLARALYKEPKILFLDEATSHLDPISEQHINRALQLLPMTQIIIAHRKETIDMADRVIRLGAFGECG